MREFYIVNRYVSYEVSDENRKEELTNEVCRVYASEERAINYIRREMVDWHDFMAERENDTTDIVDETSWSEPGTCAYFTSRVGNVSIFRKMYYVKTIME